MKKEYSIILRLRYVLFLFIGFFCTGIFAQRTITGTVINNEGIPIPGVNVILLKTNQGTTTDFDGLYTIDVPDGGSTLLFSYIGFQDQEIIVSDQNRIDVTLEPSVESLEQIVVIGYGTRRKKDLTGSVASVSSEDLTAYPAVSAEQTLQGRAAGVTVQSANGGEPGADVRIRVRGATSLNASSEAIFVIDGLVGGSLPPPEDIESIEILKDASATSIYGARGANGVVLVTTKRGKKGKMRIEINTSYSSQETSNELDLLDADEFAEYVREINPNYNQGVANTNWQDVIFRTGQISNHQVSVSGGSEKIDFYLSGTFFDQGGVVIGSELERFSFTNNVNVNFNEKLKIGMNAFARRNSRSGVRTQESTGGSGSSGVISSAFRFNPDLSIRDSDGDFTISTVGDDIDNPFTTATQIIDETESNVFQANSFVELTLLDGLKFKSTLGYNVRNERRGRFFPTTTLRGAGVNGEANVELQRRTNLLSENYFTYKTPLGPGDFSTTIGYSYQKTRREDFATIAQDFVSNTVEYWDLDGASTFLESESQLIETELVSQYARLNYDLLEKYLFTFTIRRDGSSTFSKNEKYSYFPSGAIAWNMGDESFLKDSFVSLWKWRFSYGATGNIALSAYSTIANLQGVYFNLGGQLDNAVLPERIPNDNLKWETTEQYNIGLDIGLFSNRINLTANYYNMQTTDLIFDVPLPEYIGLIDAVQVQNLGKIENKGFEFELSTQNSTGNFKWNTDFNISFNRNEILELPDNEDIFINSAPGHLLLPETQVLRVGQPVGTFFGYIYDGVYQVGDTFIPGSGFEQEAGGERFRDIAGGSNGEPDGELNGQDRTIIGDPNPDFTFGFNNSFSYKGFDLNIFVQGAVGGDMLNFTLLELNTLNGASNATTEALDRWSPINPNTDVPKADSRARRVSSRWVFDGSYARLKNITLGYSLNQKVLDNLRLSKMRFYISGQNLFTITDYPGLDPEVLYQADTSSRANVNLGLDYGSYPNVRAFTLGLNVAF